MKKPLIIGVSGVARSGKDTFCAILEEQLQLKGKTVTKMALAEALKRDCEDFIKEKLNLDVWTQISEEKEIFRPLLVWYGKVKRKQTEGRYWVEKLNKRMSFCQTDYILVSDIRYSEYPIDEVQWVQNEHRGVLIHVSKYSWAGSRIPTRNSSEIKLHKVYVEPPNEDEKKNDPIVKANANICVEWEHQDIKGTDLLSNEYMNGIVKNALEQIEIIKG